MLSAIMLTSFWAWYLSSRKPSLPSEFPFSLLPRLGDSEVLRFIVFGASVFLLCIIVYGIIYVIKRPFRKPDTHQKRDIHVTIEEEANRKRKKQLHYLYEVLAITASGVLFGWLCWLFATRVFKQPEINNGFYASFATPVYLLVVVMAATFFIGISSRWTDDDDREWWARAGAWVLIALLGWIVFAVLVIYGPPLLGRAWQAILPAGGISGFITLWLGQSAKTDGKKEEQDGKKKKSAGSAAAKIALMFAAPLFAAFIVIMISAGTSWLIYWLLSHGIQAPAASPPEDFTTALKGTAPHIVDFLKSDGVVTHLNVIRYSPLRLMWAIIAALGAIGFIMGFFINTNRFSLHAMYRNRLIRAYLGASNPNRRPNRFTGFDPNDNIQMHDLWPAYINEKNKDRRRLIHVINQALNLVRGDDLAWQQRKAESFTVTPLHAGSYRLGYRKTDYGQGTEPQRFYGGKRDGVSLGTAVTISGAAASPNMGYHSSAVVTFLMTLFNARLGWWLGNPGPEGNDTFHRDVPKFSVGPIIAEALGMTDDKKRYVYLSDGGHFENLGLYEMVLRRCRYIVVSDASQDSACNFQDLGNAIRKIRSDFGIPIDFTHSICIYGKSEDKDQNKKGRYCAVANIKYSWVDKGIEGEENLDGKLLYIKPAFYGQEPRDIYEYAKSSGQFPHESTVDQFFSESQFESYRMLGYHTLEQIRRGWTGNDIKSLIEHIEGVLSKD
jgi:hypothetical protein